MKKLSLILTVLVVLLALTSCVTKADAKEENSVCPYAGEYEFYYTSEDAPEPAKGEMFTVNEDWTFSGATEGSGYSNFNGTVAKDGSYSGEFPRLGGTISGTINADGSFSGHAEVRGRKSDLTGKIIR